jgi:sulfide:quinone oxidoreductase
MTYERASSHVAEIVIVGASVAGLEALLALHELAGDRVRLTLVAPEPDFVDRPMTVVEPFGLGKARRHTVEPIASHVGATLVARSVSEVRAAEQRVLLRGGGAVSYDTLVLAPGARSTPAYDHSITVGEERWGDAMRDLVGSVERGESRRVAFIAPTSIGWTLPLYELALLTARAARSSAVEPEIVLITREERPLAVFGRQASASASDWLRTSGVEFIGDTSADVGSDVVVLEPGHRRLPVDAVVALPLVRGPRMHGVPADHFGFIPVDAHGRVTGLSDVYAAGDATDFRVKQGGLAAQQADAVAAHIAAGLGASVTPARFTPVLRGMLFSGGDPQFLRTRDLQDAGEGTASLAPLWWPPTKIAGRYLAPYLLGGEPNEVFAPPPGGFADVDIDIDTTAAVSEQAPAGG